MYEVKKEPRFKHLTNLPNIDLTINFLSRSKTVTLNNFLMPDINFRKT